MPEKVAYICGPLTELPSGQQGLVKVFYSRLGDVCEEVFGRRAFVPHEHYDPIRHPNFTPKEVDAAERKQVCENTSVLIVVAIQPSWGGGIEVEMANTNNIPVVILQNENKKISRLLRGNPAVMEIISYNNEDEAVELLKAKLKNKFLCNNI